ncbi:putative metalloprotease CJM1_0395 family protein [Ferrovibrio sp.]|uniref:putative metalloprotease CJM1_0395 family protein n=1 Tax=Ferrovibrio sp. TaxID=1917215 RepID=UPI0035AE8694
MIGGVSTSPAYMASPYLQARQGQTVAVKSNTPGDDLSEEEKAQVAKLKATDAKVRAHERAHAAAGGQYAGAPSYSYTRGPDGQMYATSGEVSIDISPENDPQATLQKAAQVAAAALAPADPSGADRAVAAAAQKLRLQALAELRAEKQAEQQQQEQGEKGGTTQAGAGDAYARAASQAYGAANSRLDQSIGRAIAFSV